MRKYTRLFLPLLIIIMLVIAGTESLAARGTSSSKKAARVSSRSRSKSSRSSARASRSRRGGKTTISRSRRSRYSRRRGRYSRRRRHYAIDESGAPRVSPGIPPERVMEMQKALIELGYMEAPASGQYDSNTIQAVKELQDDNGIRRTGLPCAHTLKILGVSKTSNDGYSVPVKSVSENEAKPATDKRPAKQIVK